MSRYPFSLEDHVGVDPSVSDSFSYPLFESESMSFSSVTKDELPNMMMQLEGDKIFLSEEYISSNGNNQTVCPGKMEEEEEEKFDDNTKTFKKVETTVNNKNMRKGGRPKGQSINSNTTIEQKNIKNALSNIGKKTKNVFKVGTKEMIEKNFPGAYTQTILKTCSEGELQSFSEWVCNRKLTGKKYFKESLFSSSKNSFLLKEFLRYFLEKENFEIYLNSKLSRMSSTIKDQYRILRPKILEVLDDPNNINGLYLVAK